MNGRRYDRGGPPAQRTRVNHLIRITPIRLIGPDNEQVGVVETSEALRMAQEAGLDLVEIVPDTRPPVCKIMDYGKYKYELSQKQRKSRAASKATELKQVRLGRSVKIDPHDVQIRIDQSRRFLLAGHKVQVIQRFRGREITHRELGIDHLREVAEQLSDIGKVEQAPRFMGREASILIAPDKAKLEAIKRKKEKEEQEKERAAEGAGGGEPGEAAVALETDPKRDGKARAKGDAKAAGAKAAEAKAAEAKPAEAKAADAKAAEAKAAEANSTDAPPGDATPGATAESGAPREPETAAEPGTGSERSRERSVPVGQRRG